MNRRTFLKSTTLFALNPTLALKGQDQKQIQEPLKWTAFKDKMPKNKEFFITTKYTQNQSLNCFVGKRIWGKNRIYGQNNRIIFKNDDSSHQYIIRLEQNHKYVNVNMDENLKKCFVDFKIPDMNSWFWIGANNVLQHMKKMQISQLKKNMNIVIIKEIEKSLQLQHYSMIGTGTIFDIINNKGTFFDIIDNGPSPLIVWGNCFTHKSNLSCKVWEYTSMSYIKKAVELPPLPY